MSLPVEVVVGLLVVIVDGVTIADVITGVVGVVSGVFVLVVVVSGMVVLVVLVVIVATLCFIVVVGLLAVVDIMGVVVVMVVLDEVMGKAATQIYGSFVCSHREADSPPEAVNNPQKLLPECIRPSEITASDINSKQETHSQ